MKIEEILASEFGLKQVYAENIISLLDEGNTIPFIARYRKEMHGSCDDQVLRAFSDRLKYLRNLNEEKEKVQRVITEQGKWTPELEKALSAAQTLTEVEDIYRPYKPKRKTRASVAIANGLEPLADIIQSQKKGVNIQEEAANFVNENVPDVAAAIQGAKDIIAERISDDAELRKILRELLWEKASLFCTLLDGENKLTYEGYNGFKQEVNKLPSHRILAINRGEKEKCLKVSLSYDVDELVEYISKKEKIGLNPNKEILLDVINDSLKRLILPSVDNEIRNELFSVAEDKSIEVFKKNLYQLLMYPPIKNITVLGFDPGFRTGCKYALVDPYGKPLFVGVSEITANSEYKVNESIKQLTKILLENKIDYIALGNGTASRESEAILSKIVKDNKLNTKIFIVNESGASVYSASKLGEEEFPNLTVEKRSAISLARRLQDPLAELVKIDPKAIGVGQYQHDMDQAKLDFALTNTVEDVVNLVGVNVNSASISLLKYVSGINKGLAKTIFEYKDKNGPFKTREDLKKVPKMGDKAFEQCAGFLRIIDGSEPLDNTGIHPESYPIAKKIIEICKINIQKDDLNTITDKLNSFNKNAFIKEFNVGSETLTDIIEELKKPGRDVREDVEIVELNNDIKDIKDLKVGMILNGTVRNIMDFGIFVDINVHQDGLVHISELSKKFVKHPSELYSVNDLVKVKVIAVDVNKKRISLSIKQV